MSRADVRGSPQIKTPGAYSFALEEYVDIDDFREILYNSPKVIKFPVQLDYILNISYSY